MKRLTALLVFLCAFLTIHAQDNTPFLTKSLAGQTITRARVETSGGNIVVQAVPPQEARVEVYVHPNNSGHWTNDDIKTQLDKDYDLHIDVSGATLTATAKSRSTFNWRNSLTVSFKVYVNKDISTNLSTSGGGIELSGLNGSQDFETSGGGLDLDHLNGDIDGRTSGGGIRISDSQSNIDLHTSGGGIQVDHCSGQIRLETSGGPIHLSNLSGTIEANTSGGSVDGNHISGELKTGTSGGRIDLDDISGSLDAETSGGGMNVTITALGSYVRISNSGGGVNLEIPRDKGVNLSLRGDNIHTASLDHFSGTMDDNHVEGTLNGGGVPVTVNSIGGTVSLSLR